MCDILLLLDTCFVNYCVPWTMYATIELILRENSILLYTYTATNDKKKWFFHCYAAN